eukprot:c14314_g1_i1 orf=18-359(-)
MGLRGASASLGALPGEVSCSFLQVFAHRRGASHHTSLQGREGDPLQPPPSACSPSLASIARARPVRHLSLLTIMLFPYIKELISYQEFPCFCFSCSFHALTLLALPFIPMFSK